MSVWLVSTIGSFEKLGIASHLCKPKICKKACNFLKPITSQTLFINNYNHVLESWHVLLKTSYFHSLTEIIEWSIVLWLVNHSNCLNGQ